MTSLVPTRPLGTVGRWQQTVVAAFALASLAACAGGTDRPRPSASNAMAHSGSPGRVGPAMPVVVEGAALASTGGSDGFMGDPIDERPGDGGPMRT